MLKIVNDSMKRQRQVNYVNFNFVCVLHMTKEKKNRRPDCLLDETR